MKTHFNPKNNPRVIIIQKLYGKFYNEDNDIEFPKHRFKKFIKDIVFGTIERNDLILDELNTKLFDYETEIVEVKTSDAVSSELGPLKYLSGLTGTPMDKIINWLLLTIIFVFDPLAIALVIAANYAFERLRPKTKENLYGETVIVEEDDDDGYWTEEEIADFRNQFEGENELGSSFENEIEEENNEDTTLEKNEGGLPKGYVSDEIKELEDKISQTSKAKKYGPKGWKTLTKKLNNLKNNNDDDLTIRY